MVLLSYLCLLLIPNSKFVQYFVFEVRSFPYCRVNGFHRFEIFKKTCQKIKICEKKIKTPSYLKIVDCLENNINLATI